MTYNGSGEEMSVIVGYNEDRKVKNIRFENLVINGEAGEFTLEPVFTDQTRSVATDAHAHVHPRVVLISGPAIQTGEYTFRYDPDYFGTDPQRLWTGITLCVEADGDDEYKSGVQEINIQIKPI